MTNVTDTRRRKGATSRRQFLKLTAAAGTSFAAPYLGLTAASRAQGTIEVRIGSGGTGASPFGQAATKFSEVINSLDVGLHSTTFHNRALGDERSMAESVRLGTLDAATCATGNAAGFSKKLGIFDLPFLFDGEAAANCAADGEIGKILEADLDTSLRAKVIAWICAGERDAWNSKHPVTKPEDFVGLKMRTMESPIQVATMNALGAQAVPLAWGELYTSLQTKVVDGADNGPGDLLTEKLYEVTKYVSMTGHFVAMVMMLFSNATWDKLNEKQRAAVLKAGDEAEALGRSVQGDLTASAINELKGLGLEFTEIADKSRFRELVKPVYEKFGGDIGQDLVAAALNLNC